MRRRPARHEQSRDNLTNNELEASDSSIFRQITDQLGILSRLIANLLPSQHRRACENEITEKSPLKPNLTMNPTHMYDSNDAVLPHIGEDIEPASGRVNVVFAYDENDNEDPAFRLPAAEFATDTADNLGALPSKPSFPSPPYAPSRTSPKSTSLRYKATFLELFSFCEKRDLLLIFLGILAALVNGSSFPLFLFVFGTMNHVLTTNTTALCSNDVERTGGNNTMLSTMAVQAELTCGIGFVVVVSSVIQMVCWSTTAQRQVIYIFKIYHCSLKFKRKWAVLKGLNTTESFHSNLFNDHSSGAHVTCGRFQVSAASPDVIF